jgi:hypothetical protein
MNSRHLNVMRQAVELMIEWVPHCIYMKQVHVVEPVVKVLDDVSRENRLLMMKLNQNKELTTDVARFIGSLPDERTVRTGAGITSDEDGVTADESLFEGIDIEPDRLPNTLSIFERVRFLNCTGDTRSEMVITLSFSDCFDECRPFSFGEL